MEQVSYSIYSIYTADNKIYVGLSKNPRLRLHQHWRKSSNERLRALINDPSVQLFSRILRDNLTLKEANELEKLYIARYRKDSKYTVLNILSGGRAVNTNNQKVEKISKVKKSTTFSSKILEVRNKYSKLKRKFNLRKEAKKYGVSTTYFSRILKGRIRKDIGGPLLGKDYMNG